MASSEPVEITLLYFAAASTATNRTEERIPLPRKDFPLNSLAGLLASRYPDTGLGKILESSQWSVDEEMVEDPHQVVLRGGEEVAVAEIDVKG
ncbi:hypothetical protein VNI00_007967 [Paramarasmius palmivorus]|uniref:Molybdopterin synthase sulfur carrier subunit n=1 Tax=Paramarasmius palmivorus TaxID=297713 RepID=A0AAW0CZJ2_9AGAR